MADAEQKPQDQKQQRGRQGGKKESKQDRKAQKAAAAEERRRKEIEEARKELEKYSHLIGDLPLIQSKNEDFKKRPYVSVGVCILLLFLGSCVWGVVYEYEGLVVGGG